MKQNKDKEIYRIIDANLNRSREGLRVCEEVTRFVLNSPELTRELKAIRHQISDVAKARTAGQSILTESRDSDRDVGRCSRAASEMSRPRVGDVFSANIERVKESIRVLEEFYKLIDRKTSVKFSELRFKVYTIEKNTIKRLG